MLPITSAMALTPNKVTTTGSGGSTSTYECGVGHSAALNRPQGFLDTLLPAPCSPHCLCRLLAVRSDEWRCSPLSALAPGHLFLLLYFLSRGFFAVRRLCVAILSTLHGPSRFLSPPGT